MIDWDGRDAVELAAEVRAGRVSARALVELALERLGARNEALTAVTRLFSDRARARAEAVDAQVAAGEDPGPLAGVPFGVKDLFDVQGWPTTAGAAMRRDDPPAAQDAEAVRRMEAAGAILVASLNMDELAYGFVTVNACFGTTKNPHDLERLAGGSSGGSAAAVAGGMVPLSLGSDTNGSIRVPSALCGLYGLKPAHGSLPMDGVTPFVDSFDDIGPFASSARGLQTSFEVLRGAPLDAWEGPIRVGRLGGWFAKNMVAELADALDGLAERFSAPTVTLPRVDAARSAAFLMTAAEGGALHLPDLKTRALEFDPATRDRLLAGAMLPHAVVARAWEVQAWFREKVRAVFERFDVLLAPCVGMPAPRIDDAMIEMDGARVPARAHIGAFTQPLSFIGLPVIAAPLAVEGMPLGLQLVGTAGREAALFALAEQLEADGILSARVRMDWSGELTG